MVTGHTETAWGQSLEGNDIYTIAGDAGDSGTSGDGGPALDADLNSPGGLTTDAAGDLYIADTDNNRIQEVPVASGAQWGQSMSGNDMYTILGQANGTEGTTGDGGPASAAYLDQPNAVNLDPFGDLLVPDTDNAVLREVFASTTQIFSVTPEPTGVTITQGDGSQITFQPKLSSGDCPSGYDIYPGSGVCTLAQNVGAALNQVPSTHDYIYQPDPDTTYVYSNTGTLLSVEDAAGDTLTLTTDTPSAGSGYCPSSATSCTTVTAASGRSLVLGYNAAGRTTSAADPMGRKWTYAYNSADQLTSATDPMGNVTSYTYGSGTTGSPELVNDLLTITSPNAQSGGPDAGKDQVNVYDSTGRVTSQTDPMGNTTTFNYCVDSADGDCLNTATGTGPVTVTDPDGNQTVEYYEQGLQSSETAYAGSVSASDEVAESDTRHDLVTGTLLPISSMDGESQVSTDTRNSLGEATESIVPANTSTGTAMTTSGYATADYATENLPNCTASEAATDVCTAVGSATVAAGPGPATAGAVITPPAETPPAGVSWTEYDSYGDDLYTEIGSSEPGSTATAQTTYSLYNGNSVTLPGTTSAVTCASAAPSAEPPCATINADGMVTQLAYDSAGDLTSTSTASPGGSQASTTTYSYDADGEQVSTTSPDGNVLNANAGNYTQTTTYNADGETVSETEGGGTGHTVTPRTASTTYDADGNAVTSTDALGNTTTTAYNADDEAVLVTDPDGNATLTCYDGDGQSAQVVPAAGVAADSLTASSCPASYPAGYSDRLAADATVETYNGSGQVTQETTPLPPGQSSSTPYETTSYTYDLNGDLLETVEPPATTGGPDQVTLDGYDNSGELATATTGYGTSAASTVSYCYDADGNKTSVVAADGNASGVAPCETSAPYVVSSTSYPTQAAYQTIYSYNTADQLTSVTRPGATSSSAAATTAYAYDSNGSPVSTTSANAVTSTTAYTPDGQVASISYTGSSGDPIPSMPTVTYDYDAQDELTSVTDGTGTTTMTYDPFGELASEQNGAGQTVSYAYDADGQTTGITYPLPSTATWAATPTVSYAYDKAGNLASVTDFTGSTLAASYTSDGQPARVTLGSTGDTVNYAYGTNDDPASIDLENSSGTTLEGFAYSEAPDGGLLSETDTPSSSDTPASYDYDGQGRLTSATSGSDAALSYAYDDSGNLLDLPDGATVSTGATGYGHDGELLSSTLDGTATTYSYDADGNQTGSTNGTATTSATWNGNDQLTAYSSPAGSMTDAAYDDSGNRTSATFTTASGTTTENYAWNGDSLLMDSGNAYIYAGSQNTPAEQVNLATGAVTYLITDSLGSVRGTVNSSGTLTGTTSYDAWGNPLTTGGLTATTPFGYAGGYTDPDGLIYLISRYYDPQTGQFTSLDPEVDQTLAPYAYAGGNPASETDPTGQWSSSCKGGGGAYASPRYKWALWFTCDQIRQAIENSDSFKEIKAKNQIGDVSGAGAEYAAMVCEGCNWDLKVYLNGGKDGDSIDHVKGESGEAPRYARININKQIYLNVWGNIFYGYVGRAAEFTTGDLKAGVNLAGKLGGKSFSNPGNKIQRQMGYDLFHNHPSSLSDADINQQIISEWGELNWRGSCDLIAFPGSQPESCKESSVGHGW